MRNEQILAIGQFSSSWGDRMWTFAVGLYLVKLTPNSLQLAAIYGLFVSLAIIVFAPILGNWIDRTNRLKVVRLMLLLQNSLVVLCAIVILVLLTKVVTSASLTKVMFVLIVIIGASANLASEGLKISIKRDWIVVISGEDKVMLAKLNATFQSIMLVCAILAPLAVGVLMAVVSEVAGIVLICSWNVISVFVEYGLLYKVYSSVEELSNRKIESEPDSEVEQKKVQPNPWQRMKNFLNGWHIYYHQPVLLPGISLGLLYITVLGFNAIMTGYLYTQRLNEAYVSICYGLGSISGILGTCVFPVLRTRIGLIKTGLVTFFMQWSMLLLCFSSVFAPGSPSYLAPERNRFYVQVTTVTPYPTYNTSLFNSTTLPPPQTTADSIQTSNNFSYFSVILFMVGVVISRAGLWGTDITVTQLQQEFVAEHQRGTVGGVQSALNSMFDLIHFLLTIAMSTPEHFGTLVVISVSATTCGYIVYFVFYLRYGRKLSEDSKKLKEELQNIDPVA